MPSLQLEERDGPEGRRLFEQFLRKVNKLGAQQQFEAQAQRDAERSRARGRVSPLANARLHGPWRPK